MKMVDSVDELKSSRSIEGKDFPNFEMLDARIASALNKIFQNSYFKKKASLEEQKAQKEDRFLPRQPAVDRSMPFDTWNLSETQGNVFGNPRSVFGSPQTPYQGILHSTNPSATGAIPVQGSARRPVARGEERIWEHNTNADVCKKAVKHEFFLCSGIST